MLTLSIFPTARVALALSKSCSPFNHPCSPLALPCHVHQRYVFNPQTLNNPGKKRVHAVLFNPPTLPPHALLGRGLGPSLASECPAPAPSGCAALRCAVLCCTTSITQPVKGSWCLTWHDTLG